MVADRQSRVTFLAADLLSSAQPSPTSSQKTRVGGFRRHASGRLSRRGRGRSMFTPGSRTCAYKTTSGLGKWPNKDPMGEMGGINLYCFALNCPVYGIDPLGLSFLDDAANFSAGVGDNLTFGLTRVGRKGLNWMFSDGYEDPGVDPTSGSYVAGEVTEVTVEIAVTAGGASLRHVARLTVRESLEGGARTTFRRANSLSGGFIHHINPIKGHPGGAIAKYPLPFKWAAQGAWNMKWVPSRAAHQAEHAKMLALEAVDDLRESTLLVRQAANQIGLYLDGNVCDWSVDVSASVKGVESDGGGLLAPIPETPTPMTTIDASATYEGSGEGD